MIDNTLFTILIFILSSSALVIALYPTVKKMINEALGVRRL
jgi:hypothetical protein